MKTTTIPDADKHPHKIPITVGVPDSTTPPEKPLGQYQRPILTLAHPKKTPKASARAELVSLQSRRKT